MAPEAAPNSVRAALRRHFPRAFAGGSVSLPPAALADLHKNLVLYRPEDVVLFLPAVLDALVVGRSTDEGNSPDLVVYFLDVVGELDGVDADFQSVIDTFVGAWDLPLREAMPILAMLWDAAPRPPWRPWLERAPEPTRRLVSERDGYFTAFNAGQCLAVARWLKLSKEWDELCGCRRDTDLAALYWAYRGRGGRG